MNWVWILIISNLALVVVAGIRGWRRRHMTDAELFPELHDESGE